MSHEGRVVWITGAFGGLGAEVTRVFLDAGATVVGVSRSGKAPGGLAGRERLDARSADLADAGQAESLVQAILADHGRLDALVHLAGGFAGGMPLQDTLSQTLDAMLATNLRTTFLCCRAALPPMLAQGAGRIVCTAARAAVSPPAGLSAYNASKAGVVALVQTLAQELVGTGVTANAIAPGAMDTPANRAAMPGADRSTWGRPGEIARVLLFLASPEAGAVSGAVVPV